MIYRVYISLSRVRGPYCKLGTEVFLLQFMYYCVALHCIALHYIILHCIVLHCILGLHASHIKIHEHFKTTFHSKMFLESQRG